MNLRTPEIKTGAVNVPEEKGAVQPAAPQPLVTPADAQTKSAAQRKIATFISISSGLKIQMAPAEMEYLGNAGMRTVKQGEYIAFIGGSYSTSRKKEIDFILGHPLFNVQIFPNPEDPTGYWADYREKNPESVLEKDAQLQDVNTLASAAASEASRLSGVSASGMISSRTYEGGAGVQAIEADGRADLSEQILRERGIIREESKFARTNAMGKEIE